MKKSLLIASISLAISANCAWAQSEKVGKLSQDGNLTMTVNENQGKNILKQLSLPTEAQPFQATEVLFTQMDDGSYSLTGYRKTPSGNIIKGFRVRCIQDDEDNLIVAPGFKWERVIGRPF